MSQLSDLFIIFNPESTGAGQENAENLQRDLAGQSFRLPMQLVPTERPGHAIELAYDIAKNHERPLIISSSGDGGYNEVINGALRARFEAGARPVCAVLASGNANDHRRTVRQQPLLTGILDESIDAIDVLRVSTEDLNGHKRTRHAHSYVGLGLTPSVAVELNRNRLNRLKETVIVAKTLHRYVPFTIEVEGREQRLDSLVFANISQMAKVLTIAENAEPDDGRFQVVAFPYKHKARLIFMLLKAMTAGIQGKEAKRYEFKVVKDMPIQFDGEIEHIVAGETVEVRALAAALETIR